MPTGTNPRRTFNRFKMAPGILRPIATQRRQGGPTSVVFRIVCEPCNNGWMGQIEQEAKPVFLRLFSPERTVISPDEQLRLARWVFLKLLLSDQENRDVSIYCPDACKAFKNTLAIPANVAIWLGQAATTRWNGAMYRHSARVEPGVLKTPPGDARRQNVKTLSFGAARLFFQINASTAGEWLKVEPESDHRLFLVWPRFGATALPWPPFGQLSIADCTAIANNLGMFLQRGKYLPSPE